MVSVNDMRVYPNFHDGNWAKSIHCYFKQLENCTILDGTITIPKINSYMKWFDKEDLNTIQKVPNDCKEQLIKRQIQGVFIYLSIISNLL